MSIIRVTGLNPILREDEVRNFFAPYGQIVSINYNARLMEATVVYSIPEQAVRAAEVLNGSLLDNSRIQVTRIETRPVNVMGLSARLSDANIRTIFSRYGTIVNLHRNGAQATITYQDPEGAATAIREANGRLIRNQTIHVAPHFEVTPTVLLQNRSEREPIRPSTTVVIVGLASNLSHELRTELETLLRDYGEVSEIRFFLSRHRVEVDYVRSVDAVNVITDLNGTEIGNNEISITIEEARPVHERTILLSGLNRAITEPRLREILSQYGRIDVLNLISDHTEITYATIVAAQDALVGLNGRPLSDLTDNLSDVGVITTTRPELIESSTRRSRRDVISSRVVDSSSEEEIVEETPPASPRPSTRRARRTLNQPSQEEPPKGRRYLLVREARQLIDLHFITQTLVDPENQEEVPEGLTRITLIGVDGREYDVVARYDEKTQQISF